ncbi:hypothetical protein IMCC26256_111936 [Actinobacteria bacterium IMCC26256]|nr:hypothetical protein IMCC26256_111936 [Actinobacteria bacterium IMCC26256]
MCEAHKWRIGQFFRPIWGSPRVFFPKIRVIITVIKEWPQVEELPIAADKQPIIIGRRPDWHAFGVAGP